MFEDNAESEAIFGALQHLKHNKHEVLLFHVADRNRELEFDFENRPYKFIDLETGEEIRLQPSEIKETYVKQVQEFTQNLKLKCAQYKIDFIEADINQGYAQILLPYLLKRGKMRV
jgi:predicted secreted acid phosphatase